MEFQLAKIHAGSFEQIVKVEFLDQISQIQFEEFESALSKVEELNQILRLRDFVIINDRELIEFLNHSLTQLANNSTTWDSTKSKDLEYIYMNVNRLLLSYLSSIRTFQDHIETYIKREFGKTSNELLKFNELLSFFYDNSFAYRFFYELRNYTQHVGLPINRVNFRTDFDKNNNSVIGKLEIEFNRDALLSNYEKWKKVKFDLIKMSNNFELTPLIFEMTHNIREIERNTELIIKDSLIKATDSIQNLIAHINDGVGEVFVAYDFQTKENSELGAYKSIEIPFDTIDYIKNKLGRIN